jgi:glycosyltransferase involved in cell wall biosynthesis
MRILVLCDYFYPLLIGGGEKYIYEISKRLAKDNEVHVITKRLKGLPRYEEHENIHIHRIFVFPEERNVPFVNILLFMLGSFFKSLRLGNFDIYHSYPYSSLLPTFISSKIVGKPNVVTIYDVYASIWAKLYGVRGHLNNFFERAIIRFPYTKILTISNSTKEKLVALGAHEEKIEITYCGVDMSAYDQVSVAKSGKPRMIYVGRLVPDKHVDDLLVALSKLNFDAELYVVGEGPEKRDLKKLAENLGIKNKVHFTGFIDEKRKIELLKSAHVLVLPSTVEGFGIVLIEAMAAGAPVLVADIPALRELIENGQTGLLFKARNVDELKAKLELVLKEEDLRARLSKNGYNMVRRNFTWDKVAERVEDVFKNL